MGKHPLILANAKDRDHRDGRENRDSREASVTAEGRAGRAICAMYWEAARCISYHQGFE
jgi:hypothetical protein